MDARADAAREALTELGWTVRPATRRRRLPAAVLKRYPAIPSEVRGFLEALEHCVRGDEQAWFLTAADFAGKSGSEWAWDDFEKLSSEDADAATAAVSRAFWDAHLPILLSVEGDYAFLAVSVDPASSDYGAVVRGYAFEFDDAETVARSFAELLGLIVDGRRGQIAPELIDMLAPGNAPSRLRSAAPPTGVAGLISGLWQRLASWRRFERYRVAVVVERRFSRPLYAWEVWSQMTPSLSVVIEGLTDEAVIRPRQSDDKGDWLRFGDLAWNAANNLTWTTKFLADPNLTGRVRFVANEIWAPSREISFEAHRGPQLFCLVDRDEAADTQGLVLAIRKDRLRRVDVAADDVVFEMRSLLTDCDVLVFDRTWGELGRFGGSNVVNGLDETSSRAVLDWARAHRRAEVRSFRWRRSYGRVR